MINQLTQEHIDDNTKLLIQVSSLGNTDKVKRLIPVSNPKADNSEALKRAAEEGHTEIVQLLIPVSNPKAKKSWALLLAANEGNLEIVKLLIPLSDPKELDSKILQFAAHQKHIEIVKLLVPISDYLKAEQDMMVKNWDTTLLRQCIDEYESLLQKERLTHQLNSCANNNHCSLKRKI